jgi:type III restriction enzyme
MFQLKEYQQDALDTLSHFLKNCKVTGDVTTAFSDSLKENNFPNVPYRSYNFDETPYVCIRIPTGGGKTILGSFSIPVVAKELLREDFPITLWLVPTNIIQEQTVSALKSNPAYSEHLNDAFNNNVSIYDIADINQIKPQDIGNKAIIVVSTLQNLRVNNTSGRKVYKYHEDFEPHFSKLSKNHPAYEHLERVTELDLSDNGLVATDIGKIKYSFANLLMISRPIVIIDEAHNARTSLTFDVLKRFHPAALIEFTATPNTSDTDGSNILFNVSAAQLKTEEMIKLPIILTEHINGWEEAVRDAVLTRNRLEISAQKDKDYIRPIVLLQADNKNGKVTVEDIKKCLIEENHIEEDQIAIATGTQKDLEGIDLFQQDNKICYVITIQALAEGWDCSMAYVFCSVRNVTSSKQTEQLLGRVLRMPYAKRRVIEDLNRAYAHLSSTGMAQAAAQLSDQLIEMGFEELEVATFLRQQDTNQGELFGDSTAGSVSEKKPEIPFRLEVNEVPETAQLSEEDQSKIKVSEVEGRKVVTITGQVSDEIIKAVTKVSTEDKTKIKRNIHIHNNSILAAQSPSENGVEFRELPRLAVMYQGELELAEKELFLDVHGWDLLNYKAELTFNSTEETTSFSLDLEGKKIRYRSVSEEQNLDLNLVHTETTQEELVNWLDKECRQSDITQSTLTSFISQIINRLLKQPKLTLTTLVRNKFPLANAMQDLIAVYRKQAAKEGYQATLFIDEGNVITTYDYSYSFKADKYPARPPYYTGSYKFSKHYYPQIEDMKGTGEEFDCARIIDLMPEVKHWVRNLVRREAASFSLPLANANFYPDFVVELKDGRLLVIEYKGDALATNNDSAEKRAVGKLWASKSSGNCLFIMVEKKDKDGRNIKDQILNCVS